MVRVPISAAAPEPAALARAAAVIREGGLVAFPTDTLYGLAADPFNPTAVARVFRAKGRNADRAIPLIAADADQIAALLGRLPPLGLELAARFWPGPLTLLIPAPPGLAPDVAAATDKVGVRVPAHDVARGLCRAAQTVLTATSANPSGAQAVDNADAVAASLGGELNLLLDGGRTRGGPPSTIVDVTGAEPRLVRAGAIQWEDIRAWRA